MGGVLAVTLTSRTARPSLAHIRHLRQSLLQLMNAILERVSEQRRICSVPLDAFRGANVPHQQGRRRRLRDSELKSRKDDDRAGGHAAAARSNLLAWLSGIEIGLSVVHHGLDVPAVQKSFSGVLRSGKPVWHDCALGQAHGLPPRHLAHALKVILPAPSFA